MKLRPHVVGPGGPVLFPEDRPRRICIVLLSGIGDVVHGLPLAWDIKALDPEARITWIAEQAPAEVLLHHPAVDDVVVYRTGDGLRGVSDLRSRLGGEPHDLTLNVQRYLKSAWPTLLSGAPVRVGLPLSKMRDGIRVFHTHVLAEVPWKHTQDLFLDFRHALGVPRDAEPRWEPTLSEEELAARARFFDQRSGRPVAGLVVASANPKKDWPSHRDAELADALSREHGYDVLLLGGPSRRERTITDEILTMSRTAPEDCLADTVRRLLWLVSGCDLVVAPDTGPLHLAHAMGVPVIGLFGHTNPWRVGPYRDSRDLVVDRYTELGQEPDPSGYQPKHGRMETITVADVLERVRVARRK